MIYNYVRVSTVEQNTARQLAGVTCNHTYLEKVSGKDQNRPQLTAMMDALKDGDLINVHELSRLARNTRDLLEIVDKVLNSRASVKFHKEGLFFEAGKKEDPYQKLMLTMMGAFADFERSLILERQREGIAVAKAEGKYLGKRSKFSPEKLKEIKERFSELDSNKAALARELGITRSYLYKMMKEEQK
jgi:DNA invertase Pin-like site-specific DNA recombinase